MKKVLFTTSALVAAAGIATAQGIELSGVAEVGLIGGDNLETQFHTDIDVTFTMSGETDGGLTFGATVDLDENGAFGNTTQGGETIFISGSFGTLTMGDTDGALDWAMTEVNIAGSINDDETAHSGFNGNGSTAYDGQIARYDYSFSDFAFAVSAEIDDTGASDPNFGIGAKYSGEFGAVTLGVGIAFESTGLLNAVGVSLSAGLDSGFETRFNYTEYTKGAWNVDNSGFGGFAAEPVDNHMAIGFGYSMDALTIGVNYGVFEAANPLAGWNDTSGYGLAVAYDLGGGASAHVGYGASSAESSAGPVGTSVDSNSFSLGLAMSF